MSRVDDTDIAQPFVGTPAEVYDNLFPVKTSVQLEDANDPINTQNKRLGKMVWNSTTQIPVFASGPNVTDAWINVETVPQHTPSS